MKDDFCIEEEYEECLKEIKRLQNKVEELMTLYTTERNVKEDYKSIIREAIDYVEHISNVDIDWHEQDRIVNILRRVDNE